MNDYEDDYDDDGNPIRVKITKAVLKSRLASTQKQLDDVRTRWREDRALALAAQNKVAAREFGDMIAAAIGDSPTPIVGAAALNVDHDTVEVGWDLALMRVPGAVTARLDVEFHGEPQALQRLGQALVQR